MITVEMVSFNSFFVIKISLHINYKTEMTETEIIYLSNVLYYITTISVVTVCRGD